MTSNDLLKPMLVSAATVLALTLAPTRAQACGGTFCDGTPGPTVMPVDQSGENILFWIDQNDGDPHTEAHIQIQYEGDPERFAWLVPVLAVPEVKVGSQALFDNVLAGTVPIIRLDSRFDGDCGIGGVALSAGGGCAFGDDAAANFDLADEGGTGGDDGFGEGPEILDRGFAGAFEYVVITADTIDVIVDWLEAAGYQQDDDAPPILQEYLQEGFVFVAFKLRGGTGVNEIHPVTIRYAGIEPCIPIRLTRIAATEDMAIRAFFLGHDRVVPQNWPHVVLNWAKFDWGTVLLDSYQALVSMAIDEAGGRAFVTEYASTDAVVATTGIASNRWNSAVFVEIEPVAVVDELEAQGLLDCVESWGEDSRCTFAHPQVRPLLERYLPAPENVDAEQFWQCLECYEALIDPVAWSAQPGFAAELEERIIGPGEHALEMLSEATYLTRLYTLISPHEMLEDPLFHESSGLGTVDSAITATRVNSCDDAPSYIELASGHEIALESNGRYPRFSEMPSVARIERVPMQGPPQIETDNANAIGDIIDEYNRGKLVGPSFSGCSITPLRPEAMLTMLALFGIAWLHRPRRRP